MQPPTVEEVDEDADEVDAADVPATEQGAEPEDKDAE